MATRKHGPNKLLDEVIACFKLDNDAALAKHLNVGPHVISKIRSGTIAGVSADLKLRIMRRTGWTLNIIDELAPPAATEK